MITDILLGIVAMVLAGIYYIFSLVTLAIPTEIGDAFNTAFSYLHTLDGIFPVSDAILAGTFVLGLWIVMYGVKIILMAYSAIPWIGKKVELPRHTRSK